MSSQRRSGPQPSPRYANDTRTPVTSESSRYAHFSAHQSPRNNGNIAAAHKTSGTVPPPHMYGYGGVPQNVNQFPNITNHYYATLPDDRDYYPPARPHTQEKGDPQGKHTRRLDSDARRDRTAKKSAPKDDDYDPWQRPDTTRSLWAPVGDKDGFADFTYENFENCWALRHEETYPSIWEIKACWLRVKGTEELYEVRPSWGIVQPYGYKQFAHMYKENAKVLEVLKEMQRLCEKDKDPLVREYTWQQVKDSRFLKDKVKNKVFLQHPGYPKPRRYHVKGHCTEDIWDLVNVRARVWKDEQRMNDPTKQKAPKGTTGYGEWQEPDEEDEEPDAPKRVLCITAA